MTAPQSTCLLCCAVKDRAVLYTTADLQPQADNTFQSCSHAHDDPDDIVWYERRLHTTPSTANGWLEPTSTFGWLEPSHSHLPIMPDCQTETRQHGSKKRSRRTLHLQYTAGGAQPTESTIISRASCSCIMHLSCHPIFQPSLRPRLRPLCPPLSNPAPSRQLAVPAINAAGAGTRAKRPLHPCNRVVALRKNV